MDQKGVLTPQVQGWGSPTIFPIFPSVIVNFRKDLFRIAVSRKKSYLNTVRQPQYWSGHIIMRKWGPR
jgi:hypothetical protein